MKHVTVIGSGSWGTALSLLLHNNGHKVCIWSFSPEEAAQINETHENKAFLPGVHIPGEIVVTTDKAKAMAEAEAVVCAVPSAFMRQTMTEFAPFFTDKHTLISVSKGFDKTKRVRLSEVLTELAPQSRVAVLSGPSHAEEVSKGIPTTCVAAAVCPETARYVQDLFMSDVFRVYTNKDIIGVELGGALKNVIALVAGISDGLGFGDNTKAALMTRGMAEMARLGVAMGADPFTFSGLSGIGDLIVTCTSMHSRNRRAGMLIGEGHSLEETLKEVRMVVEGVNMATIAYELSQAYHVSMPIATEVYKVLFEGKPLKEGVQDLMTRDKTTENVTEYAFE